ncbi:DUF2252 domain-containing protein [Pendulispora rubella]|uniref:DUF2252 domain-containing protein n=1 Tax=Pendulispora rubella TaxID=2741070 RepID=A0ABZ2LIW7_9BACT
MGDVDEDVAVQVRDLDQTVLGNPAHDLVRLGLSLAMAARESDLPGVTTAKMLEEMIVGYQASLLGRPQQPSNGRGPKKPESIRIVLKKALRRTWKDLFEERLEDTTPDIPLGAHFWPLSATEKKVVKELFSSNDVRRLVTLPSVYDGNAGIEVVDAAHWVKGCSSLGRIRIAVLVRVEGPAGSKRKICLVDVKEAATAIAPHYKDARMPRSNAERIVMGAKHLAPALGKRMLAARLYGKAVFLRELLPQDLKFDLKNLCEKEAMKIARYLAVVVGQAHARQLDGSGRASWKRELDRHHTKSLDAPSWLWASVVDLVAIHEVAYLAHCRKCAMVRARQT